MKEVKTFLGGRVWEEKHRFKIVGAGKHCQYHPSLLYSGILQKRSLDETG
jgi:hypothetical protein